MPPVPDRRRPLRVEVLDVERRWIFYANAKTQAVLAGEKCWGASYFGVRVIDTRTRRVILAWRGRAYRFAYSARRRKGAGPTPPRSAHGPFGGTPGT